MRSRLHPSSTPSPTHVPLPGVGLLISSRLNFLTRRVPDRKSAPYWEPVRTGFGGYAEVYRLREQIQHDTSLFSRNPLERGLVAKVFRDSAPNDYESVYTSEVQTLLDLGHHERIVNLRGAADNMPPTFVCGHIDCGNVFQIETCPQCNQPLRNGDSNDTLLTCSGGHRYQKYNTEHLGALTHVRPCRHLDDCACINFLFRPYILLEELTHDLRVVNDLLAGPNSGRPASIHPLPFETRVETDERRREVLLFRLDSLIGIAEGVAFLHAQGCLHADIAPENAMIRIDSGAEHATTILGAASTKLIDFGLAKRVEDNRTTTTVVGRITFLAPEQMVAQGALGPKAMIRFRNGSPKEGEICQLSTINGDDLPFERRDFVRDVEDGQYEVMADSEVPNEIFVQFGDISAQDGKAERARALYARILKVPLTGRDAQQTTLRFSYALDLPTDIFSLGCLIAWSITSGQEDLVHLLREQANVATRRKEVIGEDYCIAFLGHDYKKVANAIDLPRTSEDDAIRSAILDVVCRCLVRSEGAYCRRRSSGYSHPATTVAADLRRIRNSLFLTVHAGEEMARRKKLKASMEASQIDKLSDDVESLTKELSQHEVRLDNARRSFTFWRGAFVASLAFGLGLAGFVYSLRMHELPATAASLPPAVPPVELPRAATPSDKPEPAAAPTTDVPAEPAMNAAPTHTEAIPTAEKPSPRVAVSDRNGSARTPTKSKKQESAKPVTNLSPVERTMSEIAAQRGPLLLAKACKTASTSLKPNGTVDVKFLVDLKSKTTTAASFSGQSSGFRLSEENCVTVLKSLDFSSATDLRASFTHRFNVSEPSPEGI